MSVTRPDLPLDRGSGPWAPARSTAWCSSTDSWPPRPPPSRGSSRCARLLVWRGPLHHHPGHRRGAVPACRAGCTVSPGVRLRTLADVVDHLGASGKIGIVDGTEIRVRQSAAGRRTGAGSSPARTSRTPSKPWWSRTARAACCGVAQPVPQAGQAPDRRARGRDPSRWRIPGPGRADRRTRGDTTAPQVKKNAPDG